MFKSIIAKEAYLYRPPPLPADHFNHERGFDHLGACLSPDLSWSQVTKVQEKMPSPGERTSYEVNREETRFPLEILS